MKKQFIIDPSGSSYATSYFKSDGTSQSSSLRYRDTSDLILNTNNPNTYKWGFVSGTTAWNKYICLPDAINCSGWTKLFVKYLYVYTGGDWPNPTISLAQSTTPGSYYWVPAAAYKQQQVGDSSFTEEYYRKKLNSSTWTKEIALADLDNEAWQTLELDISELSEFYFYAGVNHGYFYIADVYLTDDAEEELETPEPSEPEDNYEPRYLIKSEGVIYTIEDNTLIDLEAVSVTSKLLKSKGVEGELNLDLITTLKNPKIYYWDDSAKHSMSCTINAMPNKQTIITNAIDLTDMSIIGINNVTCVYEGNPIIAISNDNKQTWKTFTGEAWTTISGEYSGMKPETLIAINADDWQKIYKNKTSLYFRIVLSAVDDTLTNIIVHFINKEES